MPTGVRLALGTLRADRHGSPDLEPGKPLETIPEAPAWLESDGRHKWVEVLTLIRDNGYLADLDLSAVAEFCRLYDQRAWCLAVLSEQGEYEVTEHGVKQHPAVNRMLRIDDMIRRYHADFWLTPTARAGKQIATTSRQPVSVRNRQA